MIEWMAYFSMIMRIVETLPQYVWQIFFTSYGIGLVFCGWFLYTGWYEYYRNQ